MHTRVDFGDLVEKAGNGDKDAFREIFELLSDKLFSYTLSRTGDEDISIDILQDTFVDLWKVLPQFIYRSEKEFFGYVYTILKRKISLHHKREKKTVLLSKKIIEEHYELEVEDYRHLEKAMNTLSEKYREIIRLRYWSALSFAEIATTLDIRETTAKVRHHRAIKLLQESVKR